LHESHAECVRLGSPECPVKIPTQRHSWPRQSRKEQSSEAGKIENRHRLGDASDLREAIKGIELDKRRYKVQMMDSIYLHQWDIVE